MLHRLLTPTPSHTDVPERPGTRIVAERVGRRAGPRQLLDDVSLVIEPGEMVAIAGPSGSGKSTLLEVLAGVRRPDAGAVVHDGAAPDVRAGNLGYVPQDDVVHPGLPLRRSLRYTARLRLPAGTSPTMVDARVDAVLDALGLGDRADVPIAVLSGGQRKRASVAAELLTRPTAMFLDEPTSGLDPATAADLLAHLRRLADSGVTVALTTHAVDDLDACDRVVMLGRGGVVSYDGPPNGAAASLGAADVVSTYRRLAAIDSATVNAPAAAGDRAPDVVAGRARPRPPGASPLVQLWLLSRRTAETLVRSRLTMAALAGSPALVVAMMALLFRRFDEVPAAGVPAVQLLFWLAFASFFFGLTYGLLQVVVEMPVVRREHLAGVDPRSYVGSKVAVLVPLLAVVNAALLAVLRALDRLPPADLSADLSLYGVLLLESVAALTIGLAASALVGDATQAVLVLPMVCFPQVLFAGAVVPVAQMTASGRWISTAMATRWSFEAGARVLDVSRSAPGGQLDTFGAAFDGTTWARCAILVVLAVACWSAAVVAVRFRCRVR